MKSSFRKHGVDVETTSKRKTSTLCDYVTDTVIEMKTGVPVPSYKLSQIHYRGIIVRNGLVRCYIYLILEKYYIKNPR